MLVWAWSPSGASPVEPADVHVVTPEEIAAAMPRKWPRYEFGSRAVVSDFGVFTYGKPLMRFEIEESPREYRVGASVLDAAVAHLLIERRSEVLDKSMWKRCPVLN